MADNARGATSAHDMSPHSIELAGVHKRFGSGDKVVKAVKGLDLTIGAGEIVAFLGPNGAGKTTTIDMVLGLTEPTEGSITVFGQSPRQAVAAGRVGAVMQTGGLLRDLTVRETVRSIAALQGVSSSRVDEVLHTANLVEISGRKVGKCSGGEQQRVKMALALLTDPDLLVLDEPTAGMDVGARREFWATMREQARAGRTIVFATHYLEEAQDFAQRIVLIGRGRLLADGSVADVQSMTSGRTLAASFGATIDNPATDHRILALQALPGVTGVECNGARVNLTALDSDAVARHLLDAGAFDLAINAPTLESAFLALTADATTEN